MLGQGKGEGGVMVTKLSFVEYKPNTNEQLFSKTFEVKGEEMTFTLTTGDKTVTKFKKADKLEAPK